MKTTCKKTLINITEGNNITLHATLLRDEELFPVEMSTDVTASLLAIGVDIPLTIEIPSSGTAVVEIPSTVAPGNYVLGISGTLAGQNWRTASEVLRITTLTETGNSQVTVVGDDYDITMQVQLYSADIATAIDNHNSDEQAHPYILGQLETKQNTISDLQTIREGAAAGATAYQKPVPGIPPSDMTEAVQTSLNKADTALQEHQSLADYYTKDEVNTIVGPFITKTVDDLTNYYLKTDVYTQNEVRQLIAAISQFQYQVAQTLPMASADTMRIIYLIPSTNPQQQNVKDEFITIDNGAGATTRYTWEQIGSTEIDLSGYYTSAQTDTAISNALTAALQSYYNKTEVENLLSTKQDTITDLSTIRSGAEAGATAYQMPSTGLPQTELESTLSTKIDNVVNAVSLTYSQLTTLISDEELIPGTYYRITDYVTTTAADYTQSAGHAFDVVVLALDSSTLDCNAMAIQHEGDTYFNSADLSKWELKYDINNDTTKYTWADATNGKGVIYWMRDEWGNEFDYDFKNIMFKKYKIKSANDIHLATTASPLATKIYNQIVTDLSASYTDDNEVYAMWYIPHAPNSVLYVNSSDFSSFSYTGWTPDANAKYIEIMFITNQKGYIVAEVVDDGFFYTFDNYNTTSSAHEDYSLSGKVTDIVIENQSKKKLPFVNFIGKNNTRSFGSTTIKRCRYSVFGYSSSRMYIDAAQWICGIGISGMRSSVATRSIIGTIIRVNNNPQTTNNIYVSNLIYTYIMGNNNYLTGCLIQYSYFGYNCYYNDIRHGNYILLDGNCSQNTFGEDCDSIKLGNECCRNAFGNHAKDITGGNKIQNSIFGPECNNIIIGQDVSNVQDYAQAIEVDATTCYVNIYSTTATSSTTYLKGIVVKNSASGTSTTPKDIVTTAGNSYITTFHGANDIDLVV